ncbi:MAG: tyrosine-type recombinase/integrase [Planctomycetota bacterium]
MRPRTCLKCGADLPAKLTYPKRSTRSWFVREFDPNTGKQTDHPADSSSHADAIIEKMKRSWSPDPIQERLTEHVLSLIHDIAVSDLQAGKVALIEKLGGDSTLMGLEAVSLADFTDRIIADMRTLEDRSEVYLGDVRRALDGLQVVTGIQTSTEITTDCVRDFHRALRTGGWTRNNGRTIKPMGKRSTKKMLGTLRAALNRGVKARWVNPKVLAKDSGVWAQETERLEHEYMPDAALSAVLAAAGDSCWWRALILTTYNGALRRQDVLVLRWADVDLDGSQAPQFGMVGPSLRAENHKAKRPRRVPLHPATVRALQELRDHPTALKPPRYPQHAGTIDDHVFPVVGFSDPDSAVSKGFGDLAIKAGLVRADGGPRFTLHDLRRKWNDDFGRAGASPREQMAACGHSTLSVNVEHYQTVDAARMQELVSRNRALGSIGVA